jgi:hypothetical protein
MRMIERRFGAHTHELVRTDFDDRNAGIVVKVRNDVIGHGIHLGSQWSGRNQQDRGNVEMPRTILAGLVDS